LDRAPEHLDSPVDEADLLDSDNPKIAVITPPKTT